MKKLIAIVLVTAGMATMIGCNNDHERSMAYDNYRGYVASHRDSMDAYYDRDWNEIETGYNERRAAAEKDMDKWNDEMKSEYASLQADWDQYKEDYTAERTRRDEVSKAEKFRMALFPEGVKSDMSTVTAANLLEVHRHFVDYVDQHKDEFSRENWDEIEMLWERLGTRKNEVEKELSTGDNLKIAEQKIKYGAIKAVNRPAAKAEENAEAKEDNKK
jgi:hypothetical protein